MKSLRSFGVKREKELKEISDEFGGGRRRAYS